MKDEGEVRMFQLFAEGIEDLYTGMIENFVRATPALWDEFAMRLESGEYYLVDPDPFAPTPTVPTSENICLDIHNNVKFSPKLCLWAIEQKLESTGEHFAQGQFAEFCFQELKEYVQNRAEIDDSFYKHLVINTQSRTFEDVNYVNTIGSKVVIKPVGEIMKLSVKKEKTLQRTMVIHQPEQASSTQDATGDLSSDKIPEASMEEVTGDLPSGKIPESQVAEPTEDLPSGEISVEAKEADVEMGEAKEEEGEDIPQDEQMQEDEEEPDYAESELSEGAMLRANETANSELIDIMALESDEDAVLDPRPRIANKVMARFLNSMMHHDRGRIDAMLQSEREARERFHQQRREEEQRHERASASGHLPPGETPGVPGSSGHLPSGEAPDVPIEQEIKEEKPASPEPSAEVKIYQDELECRKSMDIFTQPSSAEFMKLLQPETENLTSENQVKMEDLFAEKGMKKSNRPFQNKMPESVNQPLEKEPRVKAVLPKPEPRGEDQVKNKLTTSRLWMV